MLTQIPITINWHRREGHLPSDRSYQDRTTGTLVLEDVHIDDSGIYVCQAVSGEEKVEKEVTVTVGRKCVICLCQINYNHTN